MSVRGLGTGARYSWPILRAPRKLLKKLSQQATSAAFMLRHEGNFSKKLSQQHAL